MDNWITELVQLMPPHPGAGAVVDWAAVEEVYGRAFPSHYQDFVRIYGEGSIMQILDVVLPLSTSSAGGVSAVASELAEEMREGASGTLLTWGSTVAGDVLSWLVEGDESSRWKVAARIRSSCPIDKRRPCKHKELTPGRGSLIPTRA